MIRHASHHSASSYAQLYLLHFPINSIPTQPTNNHNYLDMNFMPKCH
ncbi:hypothetical protein HMPREF1578_00546 [Gardnerella pickettii JCP8017B]|nr:hypothetical protein HMPREF1578_00546 [Gardnerella pickettii JCP8017B]